MTTKTLFTTICLLTSLSLYSQSDEDLVRNTIQNYFNGTSYNYLEQIEAAFNPGASLYLENREGVLMILTAEEYIAFFKKNKVGEFNGRYNKLLSIDIEGNLAQVKAEILIPKINKRYIDIFIVRKMSEEIGWKIVSKAANSSFIKEE